MKSSQETETKAAKEYYAFIFEEEEQKQTIDNAAGVVYIGELTDEQYDMLVKKCPKETTVKAWGYPIKFINKQSIPTDKETTLKFLLGEYKTLAFDWQMVLDAISRLAKAVKRASGCECENAQPESTKKSVAGKQPTQSEQPPVAKKSKKNTEPFNSERDACILLLRQEGKLFKEVCDIINKEFPGEEIDEKSAQTALERYCKRNEIPYPHGKRGCKANR